MFTRELFYFYTEGFQRASEDITEEIVLNISVEMFAQVGRQRLRRFRFPSHVSLKVSTSLLTHWQSRGHPSINEKATVTNSLHVVKVA